MNLSKAIEILLINWVFNRKKIENGDNTVVLKIYGAEKYPATAAGELSIPITTGKLK